MTTEGKHAIEQASKVVPTADNAVDVVVSLREEQDEWMMMMMVVVVVTTVVMKWRCSAVNGKGCGGGGIGGTGGCGCVVVVMVAVEQDDFKDQRFFRHGMKRGTVGQWNPP